MPLRFSLRRIAPLTFFLPAVIAQGSVQIITVTERVCRNPSVRTLTSTLSATSSVPIISTTGSTNPCICPTYQGQLCTDNAGNTYQLQCDTAFQGSTISGGSRRRDLVQNFEACLAECDGSTACVAVHLIQSECTLFDRVFGASFLLGAQAGIPRQYVTSIDSVIASSTSAVTGTGPRITPTPQSSSSNAGPTQLSDYISNHLSNDSPVSTSDNTAVYIPYASTSTTETPSNTPLSMPSSTASELSSITVVPSVTGVTSATSTSSTSFSAMLSQHISDHLSSDSPQSTSEDTIVFITPQSSSSTVASSFDQTSVPAVTTSVPTSLDVISASSPTAIVESSEAPGPSSSMAPLSSLAVTTSVTSISLPAPESSEVPPVSTVLPTSAVEASSSPLAPSTPPFVSTAESNTVSSSVSVSSIISSLTSSVLPSSSIVSSVSTSQFSITVTTSTTTTTTTTSSSYSVVSSSSSTTRVSSTSSSSSSMLSSSSSVAPSQIPVRNTGKRGLCYTQANLTSPFSLSGQNSRVSWAYDWFYQACPQGQSSCGYNPAIQFIPLLYSSAPDLLQAWPAAAQAAINAGAPALMSFNEPDVCYSGSACMQMNDTVSTYRQYMQPFAGQALLGAPAVTNAGPPSGLQYLSDFMGNCTGCTIDFVNIHWYSNKYAGASYFEYFVNQTRAIARGRPIWITEFGLTNDNPYTDAELQSFLQKVMPWMDQQPDVARYAYFMDAPGILINNAGNGLSGTGIVYNNFTNATTQPYLGG